MRASQSCGIEGKQLGGSAESRGELLRSRECERAKVSAGTTSWPVDKLTGGHGSQQREARRLRGSVEQRETGLKGEPETG